MADYGGRGAAGVYGGVWRCMENRGCSTRFMNSIKGGMNFWLILCLYSPRVK